MEFCWSAAARADSRGCIPVMSTVQVLLYMGNNHVPFGYQDTASRHQLQFPDKGEVMKRGPGYGAAVNLHGVKDCHRCQFPETGRRPFNTLENGFIGFVLEFESKSVFVMVTGSPQLAEYARSSKIRTIPSMGRSSSSAFSFRSWIRRSRYSGEI